MLTHDDAALSRACRDDDELLFMCHDEPRQHTTRCRCDADEAMSFDADYAVLVMRE